MTSLRCLLACCLMVFLPMAAGCPVECVCEPSKVRCTIASVGQNISSEIPEDVTNLEIICSTGTIGSMSGIRKYTSLQKLTVQDCNLKSLESNVFNSLNQLTDLNLERNEINSYNEDTFAGLISLDILNLDNNKIQVLIADGFKGLSNLKTLSVQKNRIEALAVGFLNHLEKLSVLKLDKNNIQDVPSGALNSKSLTSLFMTQNMIKELKASAFVLLDKLSSIVLSKNLIEDIEPNVFKISSVVYLDIGYNKLRTLRSDMFDGGQLVHLDARQNLIQILYDQFFLDMTALQKMILVGNPFHCNCNLESFRDYYKGHTSLFGETTQIPKCFTPQEKLFEVGGEYTCTEPTDIQLRSDNASAICQGNGDPSPTVIWRKDGKDIEIIPPEDVSKINRGHLYVNSTLDSGYYECVVRNEKGELNMTSYIVVVPLEIQVERTTLLPPTTTTTTTARPLTTTTIGVTTTTAENENLFTTAEGFTLIALIAGTVGGLLLGIIIGSTIVGCACSCRRKDRIIYDSPPVENGHQNHYQPEQFLEPQPYTPNEYLLEPIDPVPTVVTVNKTPTHVPKNGPQNGNVTLPYFETETSVGTVSYKDDGMHIDDHPIASFISNTATIANTIANANTRRPSDPTTMANTIANANASRPTEEEYMTPVKKEADHYETLDDVRAEASHYEKIDKKKKPKKKDKGKKKKKAKGVRFAKSTK